jgi:predicted methyltransferase
MNGMRMTTPLIAVLLLVGSTTTLAVQPAADPQLLAAIAAGSRLPGNKARDPYRHPLQTLTFFGIRPDMTVVELWPFGGWYTEILAPYLKDRGRFYVAAMDPESKDANDIKYNAALRGVLESRSDLYGAVKWSVLAKGKYQIAPDGTADMVLTFRNIHNWVGQGMQADVFAAAFRALKPGGVLGVVEHRSNDPHENGTKRGGYMGEDYSIGLIEAAGFKLVARSAVNDNPKDTKDYPKGVWTLPPGYAEGDKDRARYAAIGESDRFTLRFVKPKK